MSVRAKFKVDAINKSAYIAGYEKRPDGTDDYSKKIMTDMHTIEMSPVSGNNDPNHENTKFWKYTPSGSLSLGTINAEAGNQFELGKEYYLDFTPAN